MLVIGLLTATAATAPFPIRPGTYVRVGISCQNPANAHVMVYDGKRFRYPHASDCSSTILSHVRGEYRVREICRALGDGSPAKPNVIHYVYRFPSATRIHMTKFGNDKIFGDDYRLCPGLKVD